MTMHAFLSDLSDLSSWNYVVNNLDLMSTKIFDPWKNSNRLYDIWKNLQQIIKHLKNFNELGVTNVNN